MLSFKVINPLGLFYFNDLSQIITVTICVGLNNHICVIYEKLFQPIFFFAYFHK